MKYPIDEMQKLAFGIQKLLGEYNNTQTQYFGSGIAFEERSGGLMRASARFMQKAGDKILPRVQRVFGKVEAILEGEDESIAERIRPMLMNAQRLAEHPTNPLGYGELSALLMRLVGHLSVRAIESPTVFVGHRYTVEDEKIADDFTKLFKLEGFNPISGKTREAQDFDDKIKRMIDASEGVIIIFTREDELKVGGWTTPAWLISERSFALGKDKPTCAFFENCISEDSRKGIHGGDFEYVEFDREKLGDAFLEAIPYLRDFKQRILEHH